MHGVCAFNTVSHGSSANFNGKSSGIAQREGFSGQEDEYDDVEMYKKYRFIRFGCLHIIDRVEAHLHHPTQRNHALPASLQVFIALRFYATGSLLDCAGEKRGCTRGIATCSRVVRRVTPVLCRLRNKIIQFPTTAAAAREMQ